jgi:hypothetical protein
MAQNRPAETGVNAASNTATRQKHANSLRKEILDISRTLPSYTGRGFSTLQVRQQFFEGR